MQILDFYNLSIDTYKDFILGFDNSELNKALKDIEKEDFVNYDTWTWIEPLLALKARINNDNNEIVEKCTNKISSILEIGNELQVTVKNRVFNRVLNGEEFLDSLIEKYRQENNEELELETIIKDIMKLVVIVEMGASEEFTIEMAETKLLDLNERARELIQKETKT